MAHFAKVIDNKVTEVIVAEQAHIDTLDGTWIQTSYNTSGNQHKDGGTPLRGNYAGIGYTWDEDDQIFWPKKPYASWVKDTATATWKSPIGDAPALTAEQQSQIEAGTHNWHYVWNETGQSWDLTNNQA